MTSSLSDVSWPIASLGEAIHALAQFGRLPHTPVQMSGPSTNAELATWLEAAVERIGLEADAVATAYSDVERLVANAAPALVVGAWKNIQGEHIESQTETDSVLVVIGGSKQYLRVVAPDLSVQFVLVSEVRNVLCRDSERPHVKEVATLINEIGLTGRSARHGQAALMGQRLVDEQIGGVWMLRAPGHGEVSWGRCLTLLIGTHIVEQSCNVAAWTLLGWMTLSGRLDSGWLLAWLLLLVSIVPFRLMTLAVGGRLSLEFGASLRRKLLAGALRLDPDRVRTEGTGGLLGRVMELESIEQLALGGGMASILSLIELSMAVVVLGIGAGQWGGAAMLIVFIGIAVWLAIRNVKARSIWTDSRLSLTNDLVERMVGHRTTLAQEPRSSGAAETDQSLDRYLAPSTRLDRITVAMQVLVPRAWLLAGLLWLAPAFVTGSASVTTLAISLGGLMLARQGLKNFVDGLDKVASAAVSWKRLLPFLAVPEQPEPLGDPDFAVNSATDGNDDVLLEGRGLVFRHARRSEPVLQGVDVVIRKGDRVLLEGPSGGGKSTLVSLLSGSRDSQAGVLLLRGLDRQTLGSAWRRRVVLAPQFHHNHVLMGTFLFNLLLGRAWPPTRVDADQADRLCRKLDLGPLIDRMPGGLLQLVGETGWQLSHGERSRLFLARALLQGADLVLLDETFSALDPATLSRSMPIVFDEASTLVVIAHP